VSSPRRDDFHRHPRPAQDIGYTTTPGFVVDSLDAIRLRSSTLGRFFPADDEDNRIVLLWLTPARPFTGLVDQAFDSVQDSLQAEIELGIEIVVRVQRTRLDRPMEGGELFRGSQPPQQ
jgi:hypothetical protein